MDYGNNEAIFQHKLNTYSFAFKIFGGKVSREIF